MSDEGETQRLFDAMTENARKGGHPVILKLWDGEHQLACCATHGGGTVTLLTDFGPGQEATVAGHVFVEIDAKTLMRLLPFLLLEAQRALGMIPKEDDDE